MHPLSDPKRRAFLTKLGAGVTVVGAGIRLDPAAGAGQMASAAPFRARHHAQDDWMEQLPGGHRLVIDTTTPEAFGEAVAFAGNFLTASADGYQLTDRDNAIIIVARHFSTGYAYADAVWAKYGKDLPPPAAMNDPKTGKRPTFNLFNASGYPDLPNRGTMIDEVVKRGVHIAVCGMATRYFTGMMAQAAGADPNKVYNEVVANLVGNTHMVPAGIVAVSRAQERGYTVTVAI